MDGSGGRNIDQYLAGRAEGHAGQDDEEGFGVRSLSLWNTMPVCTRCCEKCCLLLSSVYFCLYVFM